MNATQVPFIGTALPGPKARALLDREKVWVSQNYVKDYPLVVDRAEGMVLVDMDGNRFLDFAAGIAVCATGHCHPRVVAAIQEQAERLLHLCAIDFYYPQVVELAERLAALAPGKSEKRVYFANSGAEAVETALKLARLRTGRQKIVACFGAFHGRTMGALDNIEFPKLKGEEYETQLKQLQLHLMVLQQGLFQSGRRARHLVGVVQVVGGGHARPGEPAEQGLGVHQVLVAAQGVAVDPADGLAHHSLSSPSKRSGRSSGLTSGSLSSPDRSGWL